MQPFRPALLPVLLVLAGAALAGCGRKILHGGGAPSVVRSLGKAGALNAAGEAPDWGATVRPGLLRASVEDGSPMQVKPASADHGKAGAVWAGALAGGGGLKLTVFPRPCRDAITGIAYPFTAILNVKGQRHGGCATPAALGLGPST